MNAPLLDPEPAPAAPLLRTCSGCGRVEMPAHQAGCDDCWASVPVDLAGAFLEAFADGDLAGTMIAAARLDNWLRAWRYIAQLRAADAARRDDPGSGREWASCAAVPTTLLDRSPAEACPHCGDLLATHTARGCIVCQLRDALANLSGGAR